MRITLALVLLTVVACSPAAPSGRNSGAASEAEPKPHAPKAETKLPMLACVGVSAAGIHVQVLRINGQELETWRGTRIEWPADSEEMDSDYGGNPRVEAAMSDDALLVTASWYKRNVAQTTRIVLRLADLEPLVPPELIIHEYVTACIGCKDGWLVGGVSWEQEEQTWLRNLSVDLLYRIQADERSVNLWRKWDPGSRYPGHSKEIDAFCRGNGFVWAIDNVVRPKYAVRFRELPSGKFGDAEKFSMPAGANERYSTAACHGASLVAMSDWGSQGSQGNRLRVLAENDGGLDQVHEWKESVPRVYANGEYELRYSEAKVLAGTVHTTWRALSVVGNWAVVAAGSRGLLVFNLLDRGDAVRLIPLEGLAIDLHQVLGRTFVLVEDEQRCRVDELTIEADGSAEVKSLRHIHPASRFVD